MRFKSLSILAAGISATAFMTGMTPSPSPSPASSATPSAASSETLAPTIPQPTPIKDKKNEYSTRVDVHPCNPDSSCSVDAFVVAKAIDNGELIWERRIYYAPQIIAVKSLKLVGKKLLHVKNDRGDVFAVEVGHGHLKKPKSPKQYRN